MASDNIEIGISLDNVDALAKTLDLSKALDSIGDNIGVDNLALKFSKLNVALLVVQKSIEFINKAIAFAVEGENIKAIEDAYKNLAGSMGVSADKMLDGLRQVSKGTIDETDLMQLASKAMVQFGNQSAKIPEVFAVARGAAKLFGGTAEEQFERITQAIARQRTGQLASIGIHINAENVMRQYADSIGKAANSLTDAEKRAAILNETLKQGAVNMEAAGQSSKPMQEAYKQMNVAMADLKEGIAKMTNALISDKVAAFFAGKAASIKSWKDTVISMFGEGTEQVEAKSRKLNEQLIEQTNRLNEHLKKAETMSHPSDVRWAEKVTRQLTYTIEQTKQQIEALESRAKEITKEESDASAPQRAAQARALSAKIRQEKLEEERKLLDGVIEFEGIKSKLELDALNAKLMSTRTEEEFEAAYHQRMMILEQQHFNNLDKMMKDNSLTQEQKITLGLEMEKKYNADISSLNLKKDNEYKASLRNREQQETTSFGKMKAGFTAAVEEMRLSVPTFTDTFRGAMTTALNTATSMFSQFGEAVGEGFVTMGEGSKHAAEKMLLTMLSAIGDIAIAFGSMYLAKAVASAGVDVPAAVGGAALITLGGVLKGVAGGLSKGLSASPVSGGSVGAAKHNMPTTEASDYDKRQKEADRAAERAEKERQREEDRLQKEADRRAAQEEKDRLMAAREMERYQQSTGKAVSVHIQGHYFETEQTKTRLMDIIRQASDSQDFNLVSVGG
jgi:hypothetical protein